MVTQPDVYGKLLKFHMCEMFTRWGCLSFMVIEGTPSHHSNCITEKQPGQKSEASELQCAVQVKKIVFEGKTGDSQLRWEQTKNRGKSIFQILTKSYGFLEDVASLSGRSLRNMCRMSKHMSRFERPHEIMHTASGTKACNLRNH